MADNNIEKIKALRDATGLSFNEIKKALDEAGGDAEQAAQALKSIGGALAGKKANRQLQAGIVEAYVHSTGKVGAMVELLCETDFVARNGEFKQLAHDLAMHLAAMKPASADEFLAQPFVKDPTLTVQDLVHQAVAKLGENIQVGEFSVLEI